MNEPVHQDDPTARYRAAVQIDRYALDTQVEQQPQLYFEICEQQVMALSRRDAAKEHLARKDAEIANRLRIGGSGKPPTEGAVKDSVNAHSEHAAAAAEYNRLRQEAERWTVLRDTFEQRARMFHELVALYAAGYFTVTPSVRAHVKGAAAERGRVALDTHRRQQRSPA